MRASDNEQRERVLSRTSSKYRRQAMNGMGGRLRARCLSFRDVFEPDENFFGDGTTRRSAKLAPWAYFRPRLQVAARKVSAERRRNIK